jgi:hypothetical protein
VAFSLLLHTSNAALTADVVTPHVFEGYSLPRDGARPPSDVRDRTLTIVCEPCSRRAVQNRRLEAASGGAGRMLGSVMKKSQGSKRFGTTHIASD